ncbi:MAG: twin-arginine translocase TatA/TatE family subunit [Candidatus Marinimicrobia bacterium]|nr:twin-arginine translocase TatA/TatE family subunit [Candidatus Neomarinimicrobiota bacterium]
MGSIGGMEVLLIFLIVLLLFGAKKLPELARGLGKGIREFKKATNDIRDEIESATDFDEHINTKSQNSSKEPDKKNEE